MVFQMVMIMEEVLDPAENLILHVLQLAAEDF